MFRPLVAALLCLLLSPRIGAETGVARLKVTRAGARVHVRVIAFNPDKRWHGPFAMALYVRPARKAPWLLVRRWNQVPPLGPGHRVSRDFFDSNSLTLRALAGFGTLRLRGVVHGPGLRGSAEETLFVASEAPRGQGRPRRSPNLSR